MSRATRLQRLEALVTATAAPPTPRSLTDEERVALYQRLEAAGILYWCEEKQWWSPVDPAWLRAALRARRAP